MLHSSYQFKNAAAQCVPGHKTDDQDGMSRVMIFVPPTGLSWPEPQRKRATKMQLPMLP
jgi:hypothetical protein